MNAQTTGRLSETMITSTLNKAIKVAHKANFGEESDKFDELETILAAVGKDSL